MAKIGKNDRRPPRDIDEAENELIRLAYDQARKQLEDGTAPPSVVAYFLKRGSAIAELETEKLRHETALIESKKRSLDSSARMEELLHAALEAFGSYSPQKTDYDD